MHCISLAVMVSVQAQERAESVVKLASAPHSRAWGLCWVARAQFRLGNYAEAIRVYAEALPPLRDAHDVQGEWMALHGTGRANDKLGKFDQASALLVEALRVAREGLGNSSFLLCPVHVTVFCGARSSGLVPAWWLELVALPLTPALRRSNPPGDGPHSELHWHAIHSPRSLRRSFARVPGVPCHQEGGLR